MAAGITLLYATALESIAEEIRDRLAIIVPEGLVSVTSSRETFLEDLEDLEGPLLLVLSAELLPTTARPAREIYGPLLKWVEAGRAAAIGIILVGQCKLPPLLAKARAAAWMGPESKALREIEAWVVAWRREEGQAPEACGSITATPEVIEALFKKVVDRQGVATVSSPCSWTRTRFARHFAARAYPHFSAVRLLYAPHAVPVPRDAVLAEIVAAGRTLWVVDGYAGPEIKPPPGASMLIVAPEGGIALEGREDRDLEEAPLSAHEILRAIPTVEGGTLPFSTFEFERLLPDLFDNDWTMAQRLGRKAGAFFRNNGRNAEAIWIFEQLRDQAARHGDRDCTDSCASELSWLRAEGDRKPRLASAEQLGFRF